MLVVLFKMHSEILCLSNAEKMYILHKYKNCRTKAELSTSASTVTGWSLR